MSAKSDSIGVNYAELREPDPPIARIIKTALGSGRNHFECWCWDRFLRTGHSGAPITARSRWGLGRWMSLPVQSRGERQPSQASMPNATPAPQPALSIAASDQLRGGLRSFAPALGAVEHAAGHSTAAASPNLLPQGLSLGAAAVMGTRRHMVSVAKDRNPAMRVR